jgi:hypothetical protein
MKHTIPEIGRGNQQRPTSDEVLLNVRQSAATFWERAAMAEEKEQENIIKGKTNADAANYWNRAATCWVKCAKMAEEFENNIVERR